MMVRLRVNSAVCGWAPGEVVTVERGRLVDGLIANQYVTVLEEDVPDDPAPAPGPARDPVEGPSFPDTITVSPNLLHAIKPVGSAARGTLSVATAVVPPRTGKGSTAEAWVAFLEGQNVELPATPTGLSKAALIKLWDAEAARRGL